MGNRLPLFLLLTLTLVWCRPLAASVPEFSFKGLRIGMPVSELVDSMKSSTFFLRKINYVNDYFGESQARIDSMTASITCYEKVEVGCVTEYGYTSCPKFNVVSLDFKAGRVVGITLYAFDVSFIENLLDLVATGIESKLGKPIEDNRQYWDENDVDEAEREESYTYASWEHTSPTDTLSARIRFTPGPISDDEWNEYTEEFYPVHDVAVYINLESKQDQEWYREHMEPRVEAHREAEKKANEKKVKPSF